MADMAGFNRPLPHRQSNVALLVCNASDIAGSDKRAGQSGPPSASARHVMSKRDAISVPPGAHWA